MLFNLACPQRSSFILFICSYCFWHPDHWDVQNFLNIILYKEQKIKKSFAVVGFCCKGFLYCISWLNVLLSTALYLIIIKQYVFNVLNSFFVCMDTNLFPSQSQFCFSYVSYKRWWFHWKASFWDQRGICRWQWSVLWKDEKTQRDAPRAFSSMLLDGTECFYLSHHL